MYVEKRSLTGYNGWTKRGRSSGLNEGMPKVTVFLFVAIVVVACESCR